MRSRILNISYLGGEKDFLRISLKLSSKNCDSSRNISGHYYRPKKFTSRGRAPTASDAGGSEVSYLAPQRGEALLNYGGSRGLKGRLRLRAGRAHQAFRTIPRMGGAARAAGGVQGGARRLQRAAALGRGPAARQLGQHAAGAQAEARPRRAQRGDDGGAGGAADGARLRLGAVKGQPKRRSGRRSSRGWRPTRRRTATATCRRAGPRTRGSAAGSTTSGRASGSSTAASPARG